MVVDRCLREGALGPEFLQRPDKLSWSPAPKPPLQPAHGGCCDRIYREPRLDQNILTFTLKLGACITEHIIKGEGISTSWALQEPERTVMSVTTHL